jgi:hypothetical protein
VLTDNSIVMSITQMIALVLVLSFAGAALGAALGWLLALNTPFLEPVQVQMMATGFSLQGFVMGFVLGCVVLIASAIRNRN